VLERSPYLIAISLALLNASVGVVYLVAYGFKAPTVLLSFAYLEPLELALGHDLKVHIGNIKEHIKTINHSQHSR